MQHYEVGGVFHRHPIALPGIAIEPCDLGSYAEVKALMQRVRPDAVFMRQPLQAPTVHGKPRRFPAYQCRCRRCACRVMQRCPYSLPVYLHGSRLRRYPPSLLRGKRSLADKSLRRAESRGGTRDARPAYGDDLCRMPLMFGDVPPGAQSSIQPLIRALTEGTTISLFVDEFRTPVSGTTAAAGILLMLEKPPGLIHLGGKERISRYELERSSPPLWGETARISGKPGPPTASGSHRAPARCFLRQRQGVSRSGTEPRVSLRKLNAFGFHPQDDGIKRVTDG